MGIEFLEYFDKEIKSNFSPFMEKHGFDFYEKTYKKSGTYSVSYLRNYQFFVLTISLHQFDYFNGISVQLKPSSGQVEAANSGFSSRIYAISSFGLGQMKEDLIENANFYLSQFAEKDEENLAISV